MQISYVGACRLASQLNSFRVAASGVSNFAKYVLQIKIARFCIVSKNNLSHVMRASPRVFLCDESTSYNTENILSFRGWYSLANRIFGAPTIRTPVKKKTCISIVPNAVRDSRSCYVAKMSNESPMKSQFRINKNAHAACADCT